MGPRKAKNINFIQMYAEAMVEDEQMFAPFLGVELLGLNIHFTDIIYV